jgi:hypothetical protein
MVRQRKALSIAEQLDLFDMASGRQRRREQSQYAAPAISKDWMRDDIYEI